MSKIFEIVGFMYFWGIAGIIGLYFLSFILIMSGKFLNFITEDKNND